MKLKVDCEQCLFGDQHIKEEILIEISDEKIYYDINCRLGHQAHFLLLNEKFELLYEFGAMAFQNGFLREAVFSFSAALERFFEYYIRIISESRGVPKEDFDDTWKAVVSQSERQLGMFLALYLDDMKSKHPIYNSNKAEFRNKIVHKGYFPTTNKVKDYAEYVYNLIYHTLRELQIKHANTMEANEKLKYTLAKEDEVKFKKRIQALRVHPIISVNKASQVSKFEKPFDEILKMHTFIQGHLYVLEATFEKPKSERIK